MREYSDMHDLYEGDPTDRAFACKFCKEYVWWVDGVLVDETEEKHRCDAKKFYSPIE